MWVGQQTKATALAIRPLLTEANYENIGHHLCVREGTGAVEEVERYRLDIVGLTSTLASALEPKSWRGAAVCWSGPG